MPEPFLSSIIPTIGRASLRRAVESILSQTTTVPFEVIVVNDSGRPLAAEPWQQDSRVQIIETQRRERSVARNAGAALARGQYLHFLDDDDWLLPGGLQILVSLTQSHPVAWTYGATQLMDGSGRLLFQFDHQLSGNCLVPALSGEWVPLLSSLIETRAFFEVGGFDPLIANVEDKDLLARIALRGELAGTSAPVSAILRGVWASTTDWSTVSENTRRSREPVLDWPQAFWRLRASAPTPYWQGRMLRLYLISIAWNARNRHLAALPSRLTAAAACLALAGWRVLSKDYWRAVLRTHLTRGFVPAGAVAK